MAKTGDNESGMIKQYAILSVLLLVAVVIVSNVLWNDTALKNGTFQPTNNEVGLGAEKANAQTKLSFSDIRTGGGSLSTRNTASARSNPHPFGLNSDNQNTTATSSPFSAATSTPFSVQASSSNPFARSSNANGNANPPQNSGFTTQSLKPAGASSSQIRKQFQNSTQSNLGERASQASEPTALEEPKGQASDTEPKEGDEGEEGGTGESNILSDIVISGRVVNDQGNYVSGMSLTLQLMKASDEDKQRFGNKTLNAQTNAQGVFGFINLVEGDYQLCTSDSLGYKSSCQRPQAPYTSADFTLISTANGRVFGQVVDSSGSALKDVSVSAAPGQRDRASTDEEGRYSLNLNVNGGRSYKLYFTKEGYTRNATTLRGADVLSPKNVDVTLEKTEEQSGFEVKGTVVDNLGNKLSGRRVRLYSSSVDSASSMVATTNQNGEYTIKFVKPADDYRLTVSTNGGYLFDHVPYQKLDVYDGVEFHVQLEKIGSGSVSAYVRSPSGDPISNTILRLVSTNTPVTATTDENGFIRFEDVTATLGNSAINISNTTTPRYSFSGVKLAPSENKTINLLVDKGDYDLTVVVRDGNGPLGGARANLSWTSVNGDITSRTIRNKGKTSDNETGQIKFTEMSRGDHKLVVNRDNYQSYSASIDVNQFSQIHEVTLIKVNN